MDSTTDFVTWFRSVSAYVNLFRDKTFVIGFSGEMVVDDKFVSFIHDINLLSSLGIRLVLVHGAKPHIHDRLNAHCPEKIALLESGVTDATTLHYIKEAVGRVRFEIEALLSMGLPNSPMANADIHVASGNFMTACPFGIIDGVDYMRTGKIRKVNTQAIQVYLDQNSVVLISPVGYSPTGDIFNLSMENVATEVAIALNAEKLIFLLDAVDSGNSMHDDQQYPPRELTVAQARSLLQNTNTDTPGLNAEIRDKLANAIKACEKKVTRTHLINRHMDGALLKELFTHYGIGCMVSRETLETTRDASIDDVGAILQLIEPLETEGILVRRNRELLEIEVNRFIVFEHDGIAIGCAALHPFPQDNMCELGCLAVHPTYRNQGHGNRLLKTIEDRARAQGNRKLFVLTTHATHWFIEHGFNEASLSELPKLKQDLYNYKRRSKVFIKTLTDQAS